MTKENIENFKSLNINTYLSKNTTSYDPPFLRNSLSQHEKIQTQITQSLFQTFILNIDHLVEILTTSHELSKRIKEIRMNIEEYKKIFEYFDKNEEDEKIDDKNSEEFIKLIKDNYSKESQIFASNKRSLFDSFYLKDTNNDVYNLIFTNDILLVGELKDDKYVVRNALNYYVLKLEIIDEQLVLESEYQKYTFKKNKENSKVLEIYEEICCKAKVKEIIEEEDVENDAYIEYLMKTEKYDKLIEFKGQIKHELKVENVKDKDTLFIFLELSKKRDEFLFKYLSYLFGVKMKNINIIQSFNLVIKEIFENFQEFYLESKAIYSMYRKKYNLKMKGNYVIFLESQILYIFETIKRRIFGKNTTIENIEEYIQFIKNNLTFDGYDFTYLLLDLKEDREEKEEKILIDVKMEIKDIILDMLNQEIV